MKRILFLFAISIMTHCCAVAETILPFVQNGKAWIYEASNFIYDWEETYSLEEDTMISSHKCMKLYFTCSFYHQEHLYKGAMFEKGGNVYIIAPSSTTPALIYNFSNEPGTIIKVGGFEIRIKEKKLAKYRGEDLNVIGYSILENKDYLFEGIEGIGFLGGGLTCLIDGYAPGATGGERSLKTCTVNGEVVFDLHEFYTSGQIVTGTSKPSASLLGKGNLYDLQGRRLGNGRWKKNNGQLRPGIYIMKGKKVLH